MTKPKTNYWIDFIMLISFLVVAITGLILFFMPSGQGSSWISFLGIIKHTWSEIHNWVGLFLILIIIIHFLLHWKWFVTLTKSLFNTSKEKLD